MSESFRIYHTGSKLFVAVFLYSFHRSLLSLFRLFVICTSNGSFTVIHRIWCVWKFICVRVYACKEYTYRYLQLLAFNCCYCCWICVRLCEVCMCACMFFCLSCFEFPSQTQRDSKKISFLKNRRFISFINIRIEQAEHNSNSLKLTHMHMFENRKLKIGRSMRVQTKKQFQTNKSMNNEDTYIVYIK